MNLTYFYWHTYVCWIFCLIASNGCIFFFIYLHHTSNIVDADFINQISLCTKDVVNSRIRRRCWARITPTRHSNRALLWRLNNTTSPKCILILDLILLNQFKVTRTSLRPIHLHFNLSVLLKMRCLLHLKAIQWQLDYGGCTLVIHAAALTPVIG